MLMYTAGSRRVSKFGGACGRPACGLLLDNAYTATCPLSEVSLDWGDTQLLIAQRA